VNSGGDAGPYHERLCDLDPDECTGAAKWFAARGEDERALKAFERAFEKSRDPLPVANNADWPVDYYLDHERPDDALRIAAYAADVYSHSGLITMARLMERLGRYNDAVSWYQRAQERYESSTNLDQFYVRYHYRVGGERYAQESAAALQRLLPKGLEKAAFSDFHGAPNSGDGYSASNSEMQRLKEAGVHTGDIIVSFDGYRVYNRTQWLLIRSLRDDQTASLVVWRGGGYIQLDGPYVRSKFGPPAKRTSGSL
jgi:tetratricopeptide (TPR) repeat protein